MKTLARYSAYPGVVSICVALYFLLVSYGVLQLATYGPVILGAVLVTLLEVLMPYRQGWLPKRKEVTQDGIFMVLIQGVLPNVLAFMASMLLLGFLESRQLTAMSVWPDEWPIPCQMLLMMVTADGFRYWLHRLAHEWEYLWRFHAVHHSPHRLYWLNVGRFHPVDKGLQFLFDALPFMFLGVSDQVLGLYMVCYAVNGFFQHCNIDVRLGFLNMIISGPELHRWHHSMIKEESNHNYGNNFIIWDRLFGTWYFPQAREVEKLGLMNRQYPEDFVHQMKTPFTPGFDKFSPSEGHV